MKVSEYFEGVENLKERLMNRDAVSINGDIYTVVGRGSSSLDLANITVGVNGIIEKKNLLLDLLPDWDYDDNDYTFTVADGDEVRFFDLEVYEP